MESYASVFKRSGPRVAIFREGYPKTQLTEEESKEVKVKIQLMLWDFPATMLDTSIRDSFTTSCPEKIIQDKSM